MKNLLDETLEILGEHGITPDDVLWVGSYDRKFAVGWYGFQDLARGFDYGEYSFSNTAVPRDLVVVGKGWWLERQHHNGDEWRVFMTVPQQQRDSKVINSLVCTYLDRGN